MSRRTQQAMDIDDAVPEETGRSRRSARSSTLQNRKEVEVKAAPVKRKKPVDSDNDNSDSDSDKPKKSGSRKMFDKELSPEEVAYQSRFSKIKAGQLQRLADCRAKQGNQPPQTVEEGFDRLMEQVTEFTTADHKSAKAKGSRRGGGGKDEAMDDDDEFSGGLTTTPAYLKGELRNYQMEGVNWLIGLTDNIWNGILADEMGLGKTFQSIALLGFLKKTRGIPGPHLVVCPLSVLGNWVIEVKKWCPDLSVFRFHGSKEERHEMKQTEVLPGKYDIFVTTYETANMERNHLGKFHFKYIIVDEAHRLKNEESLLSKTMRYFHSNHRLLVTGTPLQNNLHELWALLNFILPELFNSAEEFDNWYNIKDGTNNFDVIGQLHKLLKPFMIRRMKTEVNCAIPPKKEIYVGCGLSKMQRDWYTRILAKDAQVVNQGTGSKTKLLNIMMQLRKVCNHPYLFEGAEEGPPFITDEEIVENAGKMKMLDKLLDRLQAGGHRVLIFCQMTAMLNILEDYFIWKRMKYCRLDGSTGPAEREDLMLKFNAPDSELFVFMLSTRAGGLGITLNTADTVILFDSDWNPQMDLQAQDRAHRLGQKRPVTVFRFIVDGTIEERIYQRALKKLYLDAAVIQQGRLASRAGAGNKDELLSMIRFGAESMFKSKDAEITDEDLDIILQRGEKKLQQDSEKFQANCQHSLLNFSMGIEDSNLYEFEGVNYTNQPTKTLYLQGLNATVDEETIRTTLQPVGDVKKIVISPERDAACVQMDSLAHAIAVYDFFKGGASIGEIKQVQAVYGNKAANLNIVQTENIVDAFAVSGKRSRNINYNEREILAGMAIEEAQNQPRGPKLPKKPSYSWWQFFDNETLQEFWETECQFLIANHHRKIEEKRQRKMREKEEALAKRRAEQAARQAAALAAKEAEEREEGKPDAKTDADDVVVVSPPQDGPSPSKAEDQAEGSPSKGEDMDEDEGKEDDKEDEKEMDLDKALTSSERRQKELLLAEGFAEWKNTDYHRFVKGLVAYGKERPECIQKQFLPHFPVSEVERYNTVFWKRGPDVVPDWERVLKRVSKVQAEREALMEKIDALKWKVEQNTESDGGFNFTSRGAEKPVGCYSWDEEEDKALVFTANEVGYGNWDGIRQKLDDVPQLIFDWNIKSRTPSDLKQRTDHLIRAIDRERKPEDTQKPKRSARRKQDVDGEGSTGPASPLSPMSPADSNKSSRATGKKRGF